MTPQELANHALENVVNCHNEAIKESDNGDSVSVDAWTGAGNSWSRILSALIEKGHTPDRRPS